MEYSEKMTARTQGLYDALIDRAQGDRTEEWFSQDMFPAFNGLDVTPYGLEGDVHQKTVLVRRAIAIDVMLKAMTDKKNSQKTRTAEIEQGDLLLGILPMGSNGLGKVFPQFMTDDELRAGSVTNRNTGSLFGHNSMNYEKLLNEGLQKVIDECSRKIDDRAAKEECYDTTIERLPVEEIVAQNSADSKKIYANKTQKDFYTGVRIACQAVIDYANRFAGIAREAAQRQPAGSKRQTELLEMARIAEKVPAQPAESFHEAMQSITFFHIALHASMNFISLGRLDQVLMPYLEKEPDKAWAQEITECFLIKLAGRLNLSSDYLMTQDHVDHATVLGTHPYYIDQKAGVNNFLQNIILGGKTPGGEDATNEATYLILQAMSNVNLSTPGVYVRIHKSSPKRLIGAVAKSLIRTKNNPAVLNDETMIPAMYNALMQDDPEEPNSGAALPGGMEKREEMQRLANDYCVDGCWEPILNCKSDWTFSMLNVMSAVETAINEGASLSPDGELFIGAKIAPRVPVPASFEELMGNFTSQLQFFVDQCALSMFLYYMIDEYAAPSPLLSAYLEGCMEKGRDKAWGGANYNLAGIVYGGVPNAVNTLAGIRKWVFPKSGAGKYRLADVANAFRYNFTCADPTQKKLQNLYTSIQIDFDTNTGKFGNNDPEVNALTREVVDICYNAVMKAAQFAKKVYQDEPPASEWKNVIALRRLTGYYGVSMNKKFKDFKMKFTVGMGTFEQYNWQGRGIAASADRRSGEPIAPNFSPMPGTTENGVIGLFESFRNLGLNRFAGGVISDICLNESATDQATVEKLLVAAVDANAPMLTIATGDEALYRKIYETVLAAGKLDNKQDAARLLRPYANVNVRIGGWQTPFITLPISHMENHIHRPVNF